MANAFALNATASRYRLQFSQCDLYLHIRLALKPLFAIKGHNLIITRPALSGKLA